MDAFARHGMTETAICYIKPKGARVNDDHNMKANSEIGVKMNITPHADEGVWQVEVVEVGFTEPQTLVMEMGVLTTGYRIEYTDPRLANLGLQDRVVIRNITYQVSQPPHKDRLGGFYSAGLEQM